MTRSVAYFGTYDPGYPRNAVLLRGLRDHGVTVHEFRAPLPSLEAAVLARPSGAARTALAVAAAHGRLLMQHRRHLCVDAVIVGYPGHLMVPLALLAARWRHACLVFDPLVSLTDTFAGDRGLLARGSAAARLARVVDRVAFGLPHLVLADTWAHAAYFAGELGVCRRRLAVVPVGALPVSCPDGGARELRAGATLTVFQYGKWSPLHGAETVLEAMRSLRDQPVRLQLAGEGQLSGELRARIRRHRLEAVEWLGMLSHEELRRRTLHADVCLGVFGTSDKAGRVVPNKVYDALACGRPVVTRDSVAARELLCHEEDALLVPAGDAPALATALLALLDRDRRSRLGAAALALYRRRLTPAAVAAELLTALADMGRAA